MLVLCDTNILVRLIKSDHEFHASAAAAVSALQARGHIPAIVPQCCYEFYVVATRPLERNGLGLSPAQAMRDLDDLLALFRLLRDERSIFKSWKSLVAKHEVQGRQAHDTRLVAAMQRHGLAELLTFDAKHFTRYDSIRVTTPNAA